MLEQWLLHQDQLRRYVAKQLGDADLADDIVQDVYIKASNNLHQLTSADKFKSWIYRIAQNRMIDHYREHQHFLELPEDLVANDDLVSDQHEQLALCLYPLIDSLPKKYAEPLRLAELKGMPQQEVANQLGLSLSGAKSRIQRARVKFREQLVACCDFEFNHNGQIIYQPRINPSVNGCC
ncbi:RNA polymerase sigma factor SigZ [Photobacterium sp. NCIMB 13483]|uniref:RNA polymerase sigma factor SigZ n=1 Tax=Photobacterium sp. NCIMB 13483 TaxID=2022103 RepID=UPI000D17932F|nr:RNA polymerase sigma factor SigZ [Photobacterium sp. NCIMB 13483]PST95039.1 RNA polymerase sigma factor SigZ [Photobacterium sp. NCIMB 13483]